MPAGLSSTSIGTRRQRVESLQHLAAIGLEAETTRMGVGQLAMMYSVALTPSITGIITSIVITSGRRRRHISVAVRPSAASPMTSIAGSAG